MYLSSLYGPVYLVSHTVTLYIDARVGTDYCTQAPSGWGQIQWQKQGLLTWGFSCSLICQQLVGRQNWRELRLWLRSWKYQRRHVSTWLFTKRYPNFSLIFVVCAPGALRSSVQNHTGHGHTEQMVLLFQPFNPVLVLLLFSPDSYWRDCCIVLY